LLEVRGLKVFYGEVQVLDGVDLHVDKGEVVTLIGANGAGKTTTLKALSGLLRAKAGSVKFEQTSIYNLTPDAIVHRGLIHVPEGRHIFPQLTVEENLKAGGHLVSGNRALKASIERVFELFPRLKERRRQFGQTLSGGEQQMLALGRAMVSQPRMLMLDEPSLGLAPLVIGEVARAIRMFRENGITVLLVEQNANLALSLSDRGYVMQGGRISLSDTAKNLKSNPAVIASYLGGHK
jgi:branched-chain amino acid transport system ATP-binding protein